MTAELKKSRCIFTGLTSIWSYIFTNSNKKKTCLLLCLLCIFKFQTLTCQNFWIFYFTPRLTLYECVVNVCIQQQFIIRKLDYCWLQGCLNSHPFINHKDVKVKGKRKERIITLDCFTQEVPTSLLINHTLVYFASCDVVISVKGNIKESLIITQIQVYFSTVIQNKHFTYNIWWRMMVIITMLLASKHCHKTEKHDHDLVPNIAHYVILSNFQHTNNNHDNEKMGKKHRLCKIWEKRCAMVAKRVLALMTGTTSFSCTDGCNKKQMINHVSITTTTPINSSKYSQ